MLPSKKILTLLAIVIVAVGGFIVYNFTQNTGTNYSNNTNAVKNVLVVATSSSQIDINSAAANIDSDHDGLPDWEEALYGTDPHNPDTDGDGTPDGKEVVLGRNPLVKGPNDFIAPKKSAATSTTAAEKLTSTDVFARDFFAQFAQLKQAGVTVTANNAGQIAGDYLKNAPLPTLSAKQYTIDNLQLIDSNPASMQNYLASYTAIFTKYWPTDQNNEMQILQKTFGDNNPKALDGLKNIVSIYQSALSAMLILPVPQLAAAGHLTVINALSTYIQTLKMIQLSYTDPLSGMVGQNAFLTNQSNLVVSMANLRIYLINSSK